MIIISLFSISNGSGIFTSATESDNDTIYFIGDLIANNETGSISIANNATFSFSKGNIICSLGNCIQELMNGSLLSFVSDNYLMQGTLNIKDISNATINNKDWKSWLLRGVFEVFNFKTDMEKNQQIESISGSMDFFEEPSSKPISYNITGKIIGPLKWPPQVLTFEGKRSIEEPPF
jgi:hypothetical protein